MYAAFHKVLYQYPSRDTGKLDVFVANLLRYRPMCAKRY